jgi:hypothetical protein
MPDVRAAVLALAMLVVLWCGVPVSAQFFYSSGTTDLGLSMGYANIDLGASSVISHEGAFRFEPSFTFVPLPSVPQLRVGGDAGASFVLDNSTHTIISHNGQLIIAGSADVPFWMIEPELRLSWRQQFGPDNALFIEPGIAGGFAFGYLELHDANNPDISYHANSSTGFGRAFLRAGARVTGGTAGIEASCLAGGRMDFGGNAAGDLREFYIGVFGALQF